MGTSLGGMRAIRGRSMRQRGLARWSLLLALTTAALAVTACGGGGGGGSLADDASTAATTTTTEAELQPCAEDRHFVVVNLGFVTTEGLQALESWTDGTAAPTPRSGAVQMLQAYRQKGYELLYVTTGPNFFPGRTVEDVVTEWLQTNGFPVDDGTHTWNGNAQVTEDRETWVQITDVLLQIQNEGAVVDFAYTDSPALSQAFATGGVVPEHNYTISPDEGGGAADGTPAPTTPIPNDDLVAHTATVQQLPPVCQTG